MEYKKVYRIPADKIRRTVSYVESHPRESVADYAAVGAGFGVIGGAVSGVVAGIGTPLYFGWKVGDYVGEKLDMGWFFGTALDALSSVGALMVTGSFTIPALALVGAASGAVAGGALGGGVGLGRKGLESILERNIRNDSR